MRIISKNQGRKSKKGVSWNQGARNKKSQSRAKSFMKELEDLN